MCSDPQRLQHLAINRAVRPHQAFRAKVETLLEELICLLDELDGDPDLEDGQDAENDPAEQGIADRDALDILMPIIHPELFQRPR